MEQKVVLWVPSAAGCSEELMHSRGADEASGKGIAAASPGG